MSSQAKSEHSNNPPSLNIGDYAQLWLIFVSILLYWVGWMYGTKILHPDLLIKIEKFKNVSLVAEVWSIFVWGWLASICLKTILSRKKERYWGFWSILSFSILGSVVVSILTIKDETPFLIAFGMTLAHVGFWTWSKESEAKQKFNEELRESVDKAKAILDIMPSESAFEYSSDGYIAARVTITLLYQYALPKLHKGEVMSNLELNRLINSCKNGVISILEMISSICRAWTKEPAQYFESNIMLLKSNEELKEENELVDSFKHGKVFFKEGVESINEATEHYCGFLTVETSLCYHTRKSDFTILPKLLPVRKTPAAKGTETIPGAPEACENKEPVMIVDVALFGSELKTFNNKSKQEMVKSLYSRGRFDSIISLPIPAPQGLCDQLNIDKPLYMEKSCMGTVNLYRHEKGGVKDVYLLYNFCSPLLHIAADLLILREYLMQKRKPDDRDHARIQR